VLGQFIWDCRRFEIALRPPPDIADPRHIEIHCYITGDFLNRALLQEAVNRDVGMLLAPLRADLQSAVAADKALNLITVPIVGGGVRATELHRVLEHLNGVIYRRLSARVANSPLAYNCARDFPINNPQLVRYFHVHRSSVRRLMRTFECRNGVRLWCSVRRSGKTTACFDLSASTGDSRIISQTCDSTGQSPQANTFYEQVCAALCRSAVIPGTFFSDAVRQCVDGTTGDGERVVFVLDEYETLFGHLKEAVEHAPLLRYAVVQPLLNQMATFARDNLLVLLGQQPNAHFILMDQNQLSPCVQQDEFPLFAHEYHTTGGEFADLVRRVLTDRISLTAGFLDALFDETAGHPFLTANVLVAFVDWLIDKKRALNSLDITHDDFAAFAEEKLTHRGVSQCPEYVFFREAISEATSASCRAHNPWLYAVYSLMREMCLSSPKTLRASLSDADAIIDRLRLGDSGVTADRLLATAQQANFLYIEEAGVTPRIRLLGRIAATSVGRVVP
jgi:hypothetical protein